MIKRAFKSYFTLLGCFAGIGWVLYQISLASQPADLTLTFVLCFLSAGIGAGVGMGLAIIVYTASALFNYMKNKDK